MDVAGSGSRQVSDTTKMTNQVLPGSLVFVPRYRWFHRYNLDKSTVIDYFHYAQDQFALIVSVTNTTHDVLIYTLLTSNGLTCIRDNLNDDNVLAVVA